VNGRELDGFIKEIGILGEFITRIVKEKLFLGSVINL
jgi:hypothetical protein